MVKKTLLSLAVTTAIAGLTGCNVSTTDKYDNKISNSGVESAQSNSFYPIFAPEAGKVPLAIDFLFADAATSDGTANTADTTPPVTTALNKLDGFSTVAPLYIEFSEAIDPATVQAGVSVFLVKLNPLGSEALLVDSDNPFSSSPILPSAYEARAITLDDGRTPAIQILLKEPLAPKTKYLVVVTDAVKSISGESAGQAATYSHAIGNDGIMNSALVAVRGALQSWQQLAQGFLALHPLATNAQGKEVFNYTFTTGGTTDVLNAMAAPGTFLTTQMPTYAHAEGAILQSVGGSAATAAALYGQVAQGVGAKLNAAGYTFDLSDGAALRTTFIDTPTLLPYYYAGLITAIADGQGAGIDTVVDKPQSRDYQAIVHPVAGTPISVSYDTFFTAQIAARVEAAVAEAVEEQITDIDTGEGAITLAQGVNADAALNAIASAVATQVNAANAANPDWTALPTDGATVRPVLKATEALQPYYLAGLRKAITDSQVPAQLAAQIADLSSHGAVYQGGLKVPSYLADAEVGDQDAALGTWTASDTAAQALGLAGAPRDVDGVSTNVTYRFPFAKKLGDNVLPVMATLPNATDCAKPATGYPVAIYQHGITVDRTAGVLVGNALAKACVAMVAIDHVMHGVAPNTATGIVFSTEQVAASVNLADATTYAASPFAAVRAATLMANPNSWLKDLGERHNNVGKNASQQNVAMVFKGAKDADGNAITADSVGASGDLYINLNNFARTRDAMRQTVLDMLNLSASIGDMDIDADGTADDLDPAKVYFIGHSLGGIIGTTFVAVNNDPLVQTYNGNLPKIQAAILGNPGGGVVKLLENSPSIGGAKILPGLQAAAGLTQGSTNIEKFFGVMQAMVDSADPINFAASAGLQNTPVLMYTAVGDLVVPNNATNENVVVDTAKSYLAGTNPLAKALKLVTVNADSVETVPNFVEGNRLDVHIAQDKGDHSTFSNAQPQPTFTEIFTQIGSFLLGAPAPLNKAPLSGIVVSNKDVLEQAE